MKNDFIMTYSQKKPAGAAKPDQYNEYRAQLAVDWLVKGNIDKYNFYKNTRPKFTALQLFELSNLLEYWVDDNKNVAEVEQISKQLLDDLRKKIHDDTFSRTGILLEVNAVANARLGHVDIAMKNIKASGEYATFRNLSYFRNTKANYLNRYGIILSAAGQHQRALDTLSMAVGNAISTPKTIATLKEVFQKVKGNSADVDKYITALQDESYKKIYKEVEKAWITVTKPAPDVTLTDINGKAVKLSDYRGQIVVIDFWSTVCKPCVAAFPAFQRLVNFYKEEPFRLFVLNEGEDAATVKPYMEKNGYKLNVLFDNNEAIFKALNALGTPQKFVIDANGNINQTSIGYSGSDDKEFYKLKAMVELTKARSSEKTSAVKSKSK
ncbi:Thiol-disulfide isomerase and thioredoxin [Pedobacter cryoconitis]|uniref:Thiol-disulfide isomerase and thioredoxin n=2 Tax=Pedobacter cryoconitis TaxID=188932 RepID=A0A127VDZ5_9SPHI|nr:Thiol-disulfide isomerase and thioredoxin [Pedobacter cryoconitis]